MSRQSSFCFAVLVAIYTGACSYFIGPATTKSDDYYITCDNGVKCERGKEECSKTKPTMCRFVGDGVSRDAGASD